MSSWPLRRFVAISSPSSCEWYYNYCGLTTVTVGTPTELVLVPGPWQFYVDGVPAGCTATPQLANTTIATATTTEVTFDVACP